MSQVYELIRLGDARGYECQGCGAFVFDMALHDGWHRRIDSA